MRRNILAGNWKMNTSLFEGIELFNSIVEKSYSFSDKNIHFIIAPPYTHLATMDANRLINLSLAAQNCSKNENGAFTGEISVDIIKSVGAKAVIIGHSEIRQNFNEKNSSLKEKVDVAIGKGLDIIYCCGETDKNRNQNDQESVVENQVSEALFHLSYSDFGKVIVAYEPVWAIGTGITASPEQAQNIHAFIRGLISNRFDTSLANSTSILYGGSCNSKNAKDLFECKDIDGGLIGGASLKADEFIHIATTLVAAKDNE
ncbi:MAG TPA: triose-phosphate isomerase [Flavobacteriales bacterium]|nr:triose-phosphate isomerase [Flavobacteriales bacterium]